jgi:predicted alpha/beta-fold hydrolase
MLTTVALLASQLSELGASARSVASCPATMQCVDVRTSSSLTFQCIVADDASSTRGDVLLLHGFPEWAGMFAPLMASLQSEGFRSVACNLRGCVSQMLLAASLQAQRHSRQLVPAQSILGWSDRRESFNSLQIRAVRSSFGEVRTTNTWCSLRCMYTHIYAFSVCLQTAAHHHCT